VRTVGRGKGNTSTNFGVSTPFRSRLIGQYLPDASRDLATLTFYLEVTELVGDAGFMFHLSTKFEVRRPSRSEDIAHLVCKHESAW